MRAMVSGTREFEKKKCGGSHRRRRAVRAHARVRPRGRDGGGPWREGEVAAEEGERGE